MKTQESKYHELTNVILNQIEGTNNDKRVLQSIRSYIGGEQRQNVNPINIRSDLGQSLKNNHINPDFGIGGNSDELIHQKVKNYTRHILNDKDVSITPNLVHSAAQEIAKKLHNDNNLTVQSAERAEIPVGSIASAVQNKIDSVKQDLLDLTNGF